MKLTQQANTSALQSSSNNNDFLIPETQEIDLDDDFEKFIKIDSSIVSISSADDQDISRIKQLDESNTVMNSENLFDTEVEPKINEFLKTEIITILNGTQTGKTIV